MKHAKLKGGYQRVETPMAPLIDVVFLLLIFFMLTLQVATPEGDFSINMPLGAPSAAPSDEIPFNVRVRLLAGKDGNLTQIKFNNRGLGTGAEGFKRLNNEILSMIGGAGSPFAKDAEVEIDADYDLHYRFVIQTIGACTGRVDEQGRLIRYVDKIKFAQPRQPRQEGQ